MIEARILKKPFDFLKRPFLFIMLLSNAPLHLHHYTYSHIYCLYLLSMTSPIHCNNAVSKTIEQVIFVE
jgi:hypothetical protein